VLCVDQVSAVVTPGVVVITSDLASQNAEAAGTGMVLTPTGEILTNNHVIVGATRISVTVVNSHAQYDADVVGTSPENDVALLRLRGASGLSTVPLGNSDTVTKGQSVVAIGNAGGRGELSVTSGTVTSTNQAITATDQNGGNRERLGGMIAAEAQIEAGDSGGPLADRAGRVIGMNTAASTANGRQSGGPGEPTYGFAIPINRALTVAETIREGGGAVARQDRGYLGVRVTATVAPGGGAVVERTTPGSPAEAAGIRTGDVVTTLDGDPVDSPSGLTAALSATTPGQQVIVGWTDAAGHRRTAVITLGDGPAD
jgi:S1-C subfamily serine protease